MHVAGPVVAHTTDADVIAVDRHAEHVSHLVPDDIVEKRQALLPVSVKREHDAAIFEHGCAPRDRIVDERVRGDVDVSVLAVLTVWLVVRKLEEPLMVHFAVDESWSDVIANLDPSPALLPSAPVELDREPSQAHFSQTSLDRFTNSLHGGVVDPIFPHDADFEGLDPPRHDVEGAIRSPHHRFVDPVLDSVQPGSTSEDELLHR